GLPKPTTSFIRFTDSRQRAEAIEPTLPASSSFSLLTKEICRQRIRLAPIDPAKRPTSESSASRQSQATFAPGDRSTG
ncbi:MAG: hypothetical protein ACKO0N_14510, partial [Planctomycetota bacterium]